ncbi:MAG: hypothetical protein QOE70_6518 [Chthoniobacter sp.]|jgi:uncharacterized membrane protein YdjX (TVP38/TMEM64 family)|nr:hypothetical protein [Chthoniobacter sp.]
MLTALSQHLLQWEQFFRGLGWIGVLAYAFLIVALQLFCAPLSPVAVVAGLIFGVSRGFIAVELGTGLGAAINFLLSRYLARERVARWLNHHEKFRLIDAAIGREGWKIIALLRFCPIPFGLANYSYGLTAVGYVPYLLASVIAIIPANFFFVWFGATSRDALAVVSGTGKAPPGQTVFTIIGLAAFFLALSYVARVARAAVAPPESASSEPAPKKGP